MYVCIQILYYILYIYFYHLFSRESSNFHMLHGIYIFCQLPSIIGSNSVLDYFYLNYMYIVINKVTIIESVLFYKI